MADKKAKKATTKLRNAKKLEEVRPLRMDESPKE